MKLSFIIAYLLFLCFWANLIGILLVESQNRIIVQNFLGSFPSMNLTESLKCGILKLQNGGAHFNVSLELGGC